MKQNAFSLIELIFVIIILGILATFTAVKLGDMARVTEITKLKSFVGTLNRSLSPAVWFDSMQNNRDGSIAYSDYDIYNYITVLLGYTTGPLLVNCNESGDGIFLKYSYEKNYEIHCQDGNSTTTPIFRLYNLTDSIYVK